MRHDVSLTGYGYRLRPVVDSDAPLVIKLRCDPALGGYMHPLSGKLDDQLDWLRRYYQRANDYYFAVEQLQGGAIEGFVAVYDIDESLTVGEWGRWILRAGSLAAVESAWLAYRVAFEVLGLKQIYCRTAAHNLKVLEFHDSCGLQRHVVPGCFNFNGTLHDAVEHFTNVQEWQSFAPRLETLSQMIARRIKHV